MLEEKNGISVWLDFHTTVTAYRLIPNREVVPFNKALIRYPQY